MKEKPTCPSPRSGTLAEAERQVPPSPTRLSVPVRLSQADPRGVGEPACLPLAIVVGKEEEAAPGTELGGAGGRFPQQPALNSPPPSKPLPWPPAPGFLPAQGQVKLAGLCGGTGATEWLQVVCAEQEPGSWGLLVSPRGRETLDA